MSRSSSALTCAVSTACAATLATVATAQVQQVVGWGWGPASVVPSGVNNNVLSITAGGRVTFALRGDGSVIKWGDGSVGHPGHSDVIALAAGQGTGVAIRSGGGVICLYEQGLPYLCNGTPLTVPPGSQCSAGFFNGSILGPDGVLLDCWGQDGSGECGVPSPQWRQIAHGYQHGVGLRLDGTVQCWGQNAYGQCNVPARVSAIRVAAGRTISAAVRTTGTVAVWGYSQWGDVQPPADLWDVRDLVAGHDHFVALLANGTVRCFGYNGAGQCNVPAGLDRVVAIAAGEHHTIAMRLSCAGDISGNGITDGVDLAALIGAWGTAGTGQFDSDINNDGIVDGADLSIILSSWGACP